MTGDYTREERVKAREFIENPDQWPNWPVLPLKRTNDGVTEAGFSVTADYPTVVLRGFANPKGILLQLACEDMGLPVLGTDEVTRLEAGHPMRRVYEESVVGRYIDIDGLFDAGWRID
jgi:hypothetical protein